ncbi:MAG: MBL fold metallo-hydrolase [Firmicutes bacterium]|nr:MBL fold metallo-hydrolase [Bacillota bacterium]
MNNIKITDMRVLPGDSAYLLDDGETSVLVDTGYGFTGFGVAENIKNYLGERPLDYILLTHTHYDHALGSASVTQVYPDTKIVCGSHSLGVFSNEIAHQIMENLDKDCALKHGVSEEDYKFYGKLLRTDISVDDGDIVEAGKMRFRAIHMPGHTRCSFGFYEECSKLFIASETMGIFDGVDNINPVFLVGVEVGFESMDKIKDLDIETLLFPHIGVLDSEQTRYFMENMVRCNREAVDLIIRGIKDGKDDETIIEDYKKVYYRGEIAINYPVAAINLNTSIMIQLIKKEYSL